MFIRFVNIANLGEAFANLRQRNQFATLTNIALAALLWLAVPARPSAAPQSVRSWLLLAAAWLLAVGNAISSSRIGLFQLLLLCRLCALWGGWRKSDVRRLLLCDVLVYLLAMFAVPQAAGLGSMPAAHHIASI